MTLGMKKMIFPPFMKKEMKGKKKSSHPQRNSKKKDLLNI